MPATLGFTTQGGTAGTIGTQYPMCEFTPSDSGGLVFEMGAIVQHNFGGGDSVSMAVYNKPTTDPDALLFYTTNPVFLNDGAVTTVLFTAFTLDNGTLNIDGSPIFIAIWENGGGTVSYFYDTGTTGQTRTVQGVPSPFTWLDPAGTVDPLDRKITVWLKYRTEAEQRKLYIRKFTRPALFKPGNAR